MYVLFSQIEAKNVHVPVFSWFDYESVDVNS